MTPWEAERLGPKSKELPLVVQFAGMLFVWSLWLAAIAFVLWRKWQLESDVRDFDYPFIVYPIVFTHIPLVLLVAGIVFLRRMKRVENKGWMYGAIRLMVASATFTAGIVFLAIGIGALLIPWELIRE